MLMRLRYTREIAKRRILRLTSLLYRSTDKHRFILLKNKAFSLTNLDLHTIASNVLEIIINEICSCLFHLLTETYNKQYCSNSIESYTKYID